MDAEKSPSLQMAHLGSDLQGQNPGVVGLLDCFCVWMICEFLGL